MPEARMYSTHDLLLRGEIEPDRFDGDDPADLSPATVIGYLLTLPFHDWRSRKKKNGGGVSWTANGHPPARLPSGCGIAMLGVIARSRHATPRR